MIDSDLKSIENKLTAARTKLILDKPFLGALVLRLPLQHADPAWCATTGTDARKFYYNPDFIDTLKPAETQFMLAHEALHCALSHFARREHRIKHRWDLACDYAINPILIEEGLSPPPGILLLKQYDGMTAEEIYPLIDDNDMSDTLDQHLYDKEDEFSEGGQDSSDNPLDHEDKGNKPPEEKTKQENSGGGSDDDNKNNNKQGKQEFDENSGGREAPPPPLEQSEAEELSIQWQQRMAGAAQQAQQAGKLSGVMKRLVDQLLQAKLPWRSLLSRYLSTMARDDYSYIKPSSRRGDPALFPTLRSNEINILVALDVSGSVSTKELCECLSEINAIKGQIRAKITLVACDSDIVEGFPQFFESWDEIALPDTIQGGGTTDFRPVFDWISQQDNIPATVVYFTDAQGQFPTEPHYPVIWLIKGKGQVPWGHRVQLN